MIKSYRCPETEKIANDERSKRFSAVQRAAARKLAILDAAVNLQDLSTPPGNRLEKLEGNRKGQYSIRINDQYRVCFRWVNGDAHNVEIVDYHD